MKKGIVNHLRQDPGSVATTMVDYYALPQGASGWPGRSIATGDSEAKASRAEFSIATEITEAMGYGFNPARFVPYVVMHEFEALLFSDCAAFSEGIGQPELAGKLQSVRNEFATPEDINDSPVTAPSKRIERCAPGYEKPLLGVLGILSIGMEKRFDPNVLDSMSGL